MATFTSLTQPSITYNTYNRQITTVQKFKIIDRAKKPKEPADRPSAWNRTSCDSPDGNEKKYDIQVQQSERTSDHEERIKSLKEIANIKK